MATFPPNPPVQALNNILFWPFSLQAQGKLFEETRADKNSSPSNWLRKYADHIVDGNTEWHRVKDPLAECFGVGPLYQAQQQYAEFVYLHPFIQKLLYESDERRRVVEVLVRHNVCRLEVTLSRNPVHAVQPKKTIGLDVKRMQLFLFTSDLAVLAVELELPSSANADFHLACDVVNQVRRVYAPYFRVPDPKGPTFDCPFNARWVDCSGRTVGDESDFYGSAVADMATTRGERSAPLGAHWAALLSPLKPWRDVRKGEPKADEGENKARASRPTALCYEQLGDERAYSMVRMVLVDPHNLPDEQHYRLAYLDSAGTGFAYSRDFLKPDVFYDRFWNLNEDWMTTRYAISGYSFTMLTSPDDAELLRSHFQHHYFFLNLLAVMQRGSLLIFWDRLSNLLREYSTQPNNRDEFHRDQRWLSEDFAHYLARFEFSEVSCQIQGRELFDQLRDSMRIKSLNQEVLEQLRYAREIEESNYEEESAKQQKKLASEQASLAMEQRNMAVEQGNFARQQTELNRIATNWIPAALALSLLGLSFGVDELWEWIKGKGNYVPDPLRVVFGAVVLVASYCLIRLLFHRINRLSK